MLQREIRHQPQESQQHELPRQLIIEQHWPQFQAEMGRHTKHLPKFVTQEFEEYLKCGRLEHGFLRVRCESCHDEKLLAFSCKRRGFCPSCGARRMADSAAHIIDEVLPDKPIRQWVISVPFPLRFLFAAQPGVMRLSDTHTAIWFCFESKPSLSHALPRWRV